MGTYDHQKGNFLTLTLIEAIIPIVGGIVSPG